MSLLTPLLWIAIMLPFIILAIVKTNKPNLKYLLYFLLYFLVDCSIQGLAKDYFHFKSLELNFAWGGKILSLLLSLGIIFSLNMQNREAVGFTFKTNSKKQVKVGVFVFLGFLLFDFIFKMILFPKGGTFDLETFLFQATLPGLTEEIAFRGIGFWLLDKAFPTKWNYKGIQFGWGFIIITILFGVGHGVILTTDYQVKFDFVTIIYLILISSFSVGVLRKFSGNLIFPIIGHNCINLMNALIRIL
ncbi:CPBP family intramembrane glutamic endopeptidase [Soonwooa sp.]|uniref:CPBP family intramembrane glutamic endopeptidase n=1 Tax=Soonwooa sp. TaxID=1938592 RepID=UPI0028B175D8|nr:CPBP family intramembrane glutamic endopeptidase [Soonwooa sp.]